MAFPYKVPNPLKTERLAPDMGEALMLRRFAAVLDAVGRVYAPGGVLTILEEGILGRCQGVPPDRIAAYRAGIDTVMAVADVDPERVTFHSLDDMVSRIPSFEARWIHEQERLRELWQQGDAAVREAYATTIAASRTSVPTIDYDPDVLAAAYDPSSRIGAALSARLHRQGLAPAVLRLSRAALATRQHRLSARSASACPQAHCFAQAGESGGAAGEQMGAGAALSWRAGGSCRWPVGYRL